MASTQLTDEEIFSELKRFGFTPGPVTENTRPVYLKKLKKLREEQQQRGSRPGKTRSSGSINSTTGDGGAAASRPVGPDVTHLSTSRRPGRKSSVLGFSSDESDAETPLRRKGLDHSSRANRSSSFPKQPKITIPTHNAASKVQYGGGTRLNSSFSPGPDGQRSEESEKNSCSLNGRGASRLNNNKLAGEYSDSDEEEVGGTGERDRLEFRRGHRIVSTFSSHVAERNSQTEKKNHEVFPRRDINMVKSYGEVGAEDELKRRDLDPSGGSRSNRIPRKHIYVSLTENHGGKAGENNHVDGEDGTSRSNSTSRFAIGLRPRFSTYSSLSQTHRDNHSNHTPAPNHSYSQAVLKKKLSVPEDELLQQFKREELASSGSFSAHYLSMFLLTAACLFFLLLGLMYLRMRGTGSSDMDGASKYLTKFAVLAFPRIVQDTNFQLKDRTECFVELIFFVTSVLCVFVCRLTGQVADDPVTDVSEISRLESTHPKMPFQCRFRRAFLTVICRVMFIAVVVGCMWSVVYYMRYRWRREEEETRQMYDMVEKIIDMLRTHSEACQENQDRQPYLPIPHVRDSLVQPQERKKMKKIWERAVSFLSANESRIRTETQRIGGADFKVWRWLQPCLSSDKTSLMPSKVWQGKAFPLDRRNSPPNSLTPCLKIRNMFDPVMEVGENWDLAIHEAILEKCSDNDGIVHIAVDKNSGEGCVYVKCLSAEHSGKAFKALHGSWFDGKLVTVKYLRLDRYHQRFPQAQGCSTPLKASSFHLNTTSTMNTRLQYSGSANSSGFS
uniref:Inner nuclear membrane protein Man1 n=1 Tax=Acanthochromis polyacanthus TaxID=80966 RepID=A0A3Q1H4K1_9TELE